MLTKTPSTGVGRGYMQNKAFADMFWKCLLFYYTCNRV